MIRQLLSGLACAVALLGQSLRVPPSSTDRKTPGSFSVLIDSPKDRAPVALQWEFSVPPAVEINLKDIAIGEAARSAGKSLNCAVSAAKPATEGGVKYVCVLAGGTDPIPNGPIALVHYRAQADVQRAPIRVAIESIAGVSADAKQIAIGSTAAIIRIQ